MGRPKASWYFVVDFGFAQPKVIHGWSEPETHSSNRLSANSGKCQLISPYAITRSDRTKIRITSRGWSGTISGDSGRGIAGLQKLVRAFLDLECRSWMESDTEGIVTEVEAERALALVA